MTKTPGQGAPLRALLLEGIHPDAVEVLSAAGVQVDTLPGALDEDALAQAVLGVHVLGVRSGTHVTAKVLAAADELLVVGAFCIGTNQIDLAETSRRGVAVFNAPFSNTRSVVELALAEVIALTRRMTQKSAALHAGVWDKSAAGAHEVRGRTLGIVGYGNIGSQLSVLAEAIGMSVLYYDTEHRLGLGNARRAETLDEVLDSADVVTLHVDGRPGNGGMFGEAQFARMRPGALFLNLSRGFVVDHEALARHIASGHIAGAAVDVFPAEPARRGDPFVSVLQGLPNVILTPHIGGSTEEAQQDIGSFVAAKLRDFVSDGTTSLSVNLPRLAMEPPPHTHRLAHLHRNVPGVLATINRVLADHSVNVEGQILTTSGEYGYAITDIAVDYSEDVLVTLAAMPETVRLRLLS